ncbi:AhpC/TSA family protein [Labilibaculum sp. DW002]|uniref:AhpC/TSA family protein n=1 Tax=Paralabilibaculum antarcticum TaxID=2912572 RepID=A0ABT5VSE4_9BACT|nr:TlpA disulfide reductase family protein [Labilibaculum sp. DW002]MDE5418346.1 AhpC/TSA family protein [Labilibaculum sp. DW002]
MKKLLLALPFLLFWACSQKEVAEIEGEIVNANGKVLYLDKLHTSSTELMDSVVIGDNGRFKLEVEVTQPDFYLLRLSNGKLITLLLEPKEDVLMHIKGPEMSKDYIVEGSKGSKLVKQITDTLNNTKAKLASIRKELNEKKSDPNYSSISQNLLAEYVETLQNQRKFSVDFVMKNATSLSSYMALYQKLDDKTFTLNENDDIQYVKIVASSMRALYPEHEYTKAILHNYKTLENNLSNLKIKQLIQEKGASFPDITLPNTKNKEVSLSSFDGKFVILSYWASQDANSRKQNSTLSKIYKKYKNKGLEIYQVSVDQNEDQWKEAIKKDGLKWTNVCELENGSAMAVRNFNVQQIPANYLISRQGEIVGKNLYGLALEEKVADYVK